MSVGNAWMPMYWGDYLRDTHHLGATAHGGYLLLIARYWTEGPLPDDDKKLAAFARMTPREWSQHGPTIREFFRADGMHLHHKRIDAERAKTVALSAKRGEAAQSRWKANRNQSHSKSNANALHVECQSQSQPQEQSSEANASGDVPPPVVVPLPVARDARDALWADGVPILMRLTGKGNSGCRAMLGALLRDMQDDCAALMLRLREAEALRPADPAAWLTAACRPRDGGGFRGKQDNRSDLMDYFTRRA